MNFKVTYTVHFEKEAKRLAKKYPSLQGDIVKLISELTRNPEQGTPLGKGLYKVRLAIASKAKGKSGGARVITYVLFQNGTVYLTAIYDKSEMDTVSTSVMLKILRDEHIISS